MPSLENRASRSAARLVGLTVGSVGHDPMHLELVSPPSAQLGEPGAHVPVLITTHVASVAAQDILVRTIS